MWLVTAIGPVHGQNRFSFVLQQGKDYSVGRDDSSEIKFESKQVRPKEGTLVVGDWNALQPNKAPVLKWKNEPKKSGAYGVIRTLTPTDTADVGSFDREDYVVDEIADSQGCFLEKESVCGIKISEGLWFTAEWREFSIQYDKMKDESAEVRQLLTQYCIAWTQTFDTSSRPTLVLSALYRSNVECNYAVCFGIRILTPSYLHAFISRLKACWKKMADSQDSFALPDRDAEAFQPEFDNALPTSRKDPQVWLPDEKRETLFKGWKFLGLRARTPPAEKRYLLAMGADYQDMDIVTKPLANAQDFADRISSWLSHVDGNGGRELAGVVWFAPVKQKYEEKGINYASVVIATCQRLGVYHTHGGILWGSVNKGGVMDYLFAVASNLPRNTNPHKDDRIPSSVASTQATIPAVPGHALSSQAAPGPATSQMGMSARPDFIPSTFPDETENRLRRSPSPSSRPSRLQRRSRQATSPLPKEKTPEPGPSAPAKKPLRRRANRPVDFTQIPDSPPQSHENTEDENSQLSQPLFSQHSMVPDSMPALSQMTGIPTTQRTQTQSMVPDSFPPSQSIAPGKSSKLKRRAGGAQPSLIEEIADTSINLEQSFKDEEKADGIRQLYEQTKTGSFAPSLAKRPRHAQRGSAESDSVVMPGSVPMDIDDTVERSSRSSKRAASPSGAMPPPAQRRRAESPTEETEEIEAGPQAGQGSPVKLKSQQAKSQMPTTNKDKDEAFLQAIKKSAKARSTVDELDKEFNQLRIPKPNGTSAVVKANQWNASVPDYAIVNGFDEELKGNFIQIVRKDLFRKDQGVNKEVQRVDDGKPNFKKFKKKNIVRREPMQLALAAPTIQDAELGEPYWPTQSANRSRKGGRTQATQMDDDDVDMPLLPRARKRLLGTQVNQDEDEPPSTIRLKGRQKSSVPETQQSQLSTQMPIVTRKTRAQSVLSEAESVNSVATRSIRGGPIAKRGKNKKEAVVLEDSQEEEQDEDGVDWGLNASNSNSTRLRSGKESSTQARTINTGTKTLQGDEPPSISIRQRNVNTQSNSGMGTRGTQASQRRRLLPADDDDEVAFKGLGKKRRLL
ncbi:uncharacterized protein I206_101141 [Kwoniella pini CBS 10737]|uniref:Uncharacterized protein n=1 Tax=Kwoniella pini CBS 10737 TaxID=1296096 RepID=A0AAJ8MMN2_9TREE